MSPNTFKLTRQHFLIALKYFSGPLKNLCGPLKHFMLRSSTFLARSNTLFCAQTLYFALKHFISCSNTFVACSNILCCAQTFYVALEHFMSFHFWNAGLPCLSNWSHLVPLAQPGGAPNTNILDFLYTSRDKVSFSEQPKYYVFSKWM